MTIYNYYSLNEAHKARGVVVVIDVLRAFTTAACAFEAGADRIFPVATIDEAFNLRQSIPWALIMGEDLGNKVGGFDFGNSPAEISNQNLDGKILIQRTTAGTQGIVQVQGADQLLAASFVVASATGNFIQTLKPSLVSFVVTGDSYGRDGDEDRACGEYIEALIKGMYPNPDKFSNRVKSSSVGMTVSAGEIATVSANDLELSIQINKFDFYMPVIFDDGALIIIKGEQK